MRNADDMGMPPPDAERIIRGGPEDPATKYKDRVAPEHEMAMQAIGMARMMLSAEHVRPQLELLDKAERDAHSIGHITDPTLYRDMIDSKSFAQQMTLVRAALAFLRATDDIARAVGGN